MMSSLFKIFRRLWVILIVMMPFTYTPTWAAECPAGELTASDKKNLRYTIKSFGLSGEDIPALKASIIGERSLASDEERKDVSLGSPIFTIPARYSLLSVFDLSQLKYVGYINSLLSEDIAGYELSITSGSTKGATTDQLKADATLSLTYGGFKGSAAYAHDKLVQETTATGNASVVAKQWARNALMLTTQGKDYSAYLDGPDLAAEEINNYFTVQIRTDGLTGNTYRHVEVIKPFASNASPRAFIQALVAMETEFGNLGFQYHLFDKDSAVYKSTLNDMQCLSEEIKSSITNFYNNWGEGFASTLYGYNQVDGSGTLATSSSASSTETNNSGSISAGYSSIGFGVSASATVSKYSKTASAFANSNLTVNVLAVPGSNGVDTVAWGKDLQAMLQAAINGTNTAASIPSSGLQARAATLPTPVEPKKPEVPPLGTYKNYSEYVDVQNKMKDNWQPPTPRPPSTPPPDQPERDDSVLSDVNSLANDDPAGRNSFSSVISQASQRSLKVAVVGNTAKHTYLLRTRVRTNRLYLKVHRELRKLRSQSKKEAALASNVAAHANSTGEKARVVLNKMVASGFNGTPYAEVIPALRPLLDVPGSTASFNGYPVTAELYTILDHFSNVQTYVNFINTFSAANIPKGTAPLASKYNGFIQIFQNSALDEITLAQNAGSDMTRDYVKSFLVNWLYGSENQDGTYNKSESRLYKELGNEKYYDYIFGLLKTENYKIIAKAPGGYIPFRTNKDGQIEKLTLTQAAFNSNTSGSPIRFTSQTGISQLFPAAQSTFFPVFYYDSGTPRLTFMVNTGGYVLSFSKQFSVIPNKNTGSTNLTQDSPVFSWPVRTDKIAEFKGTDLSWEYYMDIGEGFDPSLNVLVVNLKQNTGTANFAQGGSQYNVTKTFNGLWPFIEIPYNLGNKSGYLDLQNQNLYNSGWARVSSLWRKSGGGIPVRAYYGSTLATLIDTDNSAFNDKTHSHYVGYMMLLPVNSETVVDRGTYQQMYSYAGIPSADAVFFGVDSSTYPGRKRYGFDASYSRAILN